MGRKPKEEGIHAYMCLIHYAIQQKLTYCKAIILQKRNFFLIYANKSTATFVPLGMPLGSTPITVWCLTYLSSWTPGLCGAPWGWCTGGWYFLSGTQRAVGSSPGNRGNRSRTSTEASTTHFSVIRSSWWRQKRANIQSEFRTQLEALELQKMKKTPSFLRSLM